MEITSSNEKIKVCVVMASSRVGGEAINSLIKKFSDKVSIRAVFRSKEKALNFASSMKDMNINISYFPNSEEKISNVENERKISNVSNVDEKLEISKVSNGKDEIDFTHNVSNVDEKNNPISSNVSNVEEKNIFSDVSNANKKIKISHDSNVENESANFDVSNVDEKPNFSNVTSIKISIGLDAMDPSTHNVAFTNIEKAFIIAPQSENRSDIVNSLLNGASSFGVKHVVLIGGVFQEEEKFLFHKQWMKSRRHAEKLGLHWTQLECSDFMENVYRNRDNIRFKKKFIGVGKGGLSLPVSLKDVGNAAASILSCSDERHKNRGYRIVGPDLLSLSNIVDLFSEKLGFTVELVDSGVEEAREAAIRAGIMPKWQAEGFYDWIELYFMTNKFKEVKSDLPLLGINPISFNDWLQERISEFQ